MFCFGLLVWPFALGVVFVLLFCFVFIGLSTDQTYESTNDSMPGVAKTATVVMMSAALVQKKIVKQKECSCSAVVVPNLF